METMLTVATFYHFAKLYNYEDMKPVIVDVCNQNGIKGTILLAEEGVNSTIVGKRCNLHKFFAFLKTDPRLKDLCWRESECTFLPFQKLKVRLKKEMVSLADKDLELMEKNQQKGQYIEPENWDVFTNRNDVKTIDVRNSYEVKVGRFKNAIDPNTLHFRDFIQWVEQWIKQEKIKKDQKIAMYCTGGIRCEKSTAYMQKIGFKNVYHLRGGILAYFEKTQNKNNAWCGNCFVFDDRVAIDKNLKQVQLSCTSCGAVVTTDDLQNVSKGKINCRACARSI